MSKLEQTDNNIILKKGTQANSQLSTTYFQEGEPYFLTDTVQVGIADSANGKYTLPRTLFSQTATGTIANSTTETAISSTGVGSLTLPVSFFIIGKTIRVKASGTLGTILTPTLQIRFKLGSTAVIDTTSLTLPALTGNKFWTAEATITCRTTGATGTVQGQGYLMFDNTTIPFIIAPANTGTSTIDTTATQAVSLTAQWGTANTANTISCTNLTLEALN